MREPSKAAVHFTVLRLLLAGATALPEAQAALRPVKGVLLTRSMLTRWFVDRSVSGCDGYSGQSAGAMKEPNCSHVQL